MARQKARMAPHNGHCSQERPEIAGPRPAASPPGRLLSAQEAATMLGIATATLYDWLTQLDNGTLYIRGERFSIDYLQGGAKGQGRIKIESSEIERIKGAMRVRPRLISPRRPARAQVAYPGIHVPLGRPEDN